ncbi:MAG TPA: glycosyltransferase family 2 protein [Terriglobales bacterium]|nr:glycosyltransferase family 2 protein [Terriglobales bacterium]
MTANRNPFVSVIVPARNEESCLGSCLESLAAQTGIDYEIIIVDDASTDRTAEIARSFPGVRVIEAGPLPENWTGKNNAMAAGAKIAKGTWLLFTDADTIHKPGSLARAVAEAEQHRATLLSYSPEQEVRSFWEKAVMPVIFAELASTYPPKKVSDPSSPIAAANGQYLLISREAYDAVGGHTRIASDLLEDVAMARLVKSAGRKIFFRYGGDAVRTRMYRSWPQMKEGWTKNLAILFPRPRVLGLFRGIEFLLIAGNVIAAVAARLLGRQDVAVATGLLAFLLVASFFLRVQRAHFSALSNVLALLGLPIVAYLLFRSAVLHRRHAVTWKGRSYGQPYGKAGGLSSQLRRGGM